MTNKKIYRDFQDYWRSGKHGYSSASKDEAIAIWEDLESTINASRDDYKNSFLQLMQENASLKSEITDALLKYVELYSSQDAPKFWRWYMDSYSKKD